MKHLAGVAIFLATLSSLSACAISNADKAMTTRNITIADFNSIDAATGIKVIYSQGPLSAAKVTAPRHYFNYLDISVDKGTLELRINQTFWQKFNSVNDDITVTVSSPTINDLEVSSGASIIVKGVVKINNSAELEATSGASISIPGGFKSKGKVELDTSSGSSININGLNASRIDAELSSGSSMQLTNATATHADFELSSGASCTVSGKTSSLKVEATSGASFNGSKFRAHTADIEAGSGGSVNYNAERAKEDTGNTGSATNHR